MPIKLTKKFVQKYDKLPVDIQSKVKKAIHFLDANFRHPGLRSHPVAGRPGVYEAYVGQKYRLTYERKGDMLFLRNVDNHDECLRKP